MTEDEFRKKFNVRMCHRCCACCKHGRDLCDDGVYDCVHPLLGRDGVQYGIVVSAEFVCDAWEGIKS